MKKFLQICGILGFGFLCGGYAFAACNSPIVLGYDANQEVDDNEFIYPSESNHTAAVNGYKNSKGQNSGSGKGYECDHFNSPSCTINDVVTLEPGHFFGGKQYNETRKYQCKTVGYFGDDYWQVVDDGMCHTEQYGKISVNDKYSKLLTLEQCSGYEVSDSTYGTKFELWCYTGPRLKCVAVECKNGIKPNKDGICIPDDIDPGKKYCDGKYDGIQISLVPGYDYSAIYNSMTHNQCAQLNANPDSNGTVFILQCTKEAKFRCCPTKCSGNMFADTAGCQCRKPGVTINKSCTEKRKGKPVGVACCNLEDAGLARYDSTQNVCICNDVNAKFEIDTSNGTGRCVTQQIPQCDTTTGARLNQNTNRCECATTELKLNADGVSCSCADSNKVYKNGKCEYSEEYLLLIKLKEIREVRARLDGIMNGFKVSVWKDTEGNFNTARLASDSIAGVVLGTVGGVVTSVVVKKNQLKKGFEAIQCAIGGQTVADYNDEFVVGPAR